MRSYFMEFLLGLNEIIYANNLVMTSSYIVIMFINFSILLDFPVFSIVFCLDNTLLVNRARVCYSGKNIPERSGHKRKEVPYEAVP